MNNLKVLALVVAIAFSGWGCNTVEKPSDYFLFVGTYTGESSEGIYLYKFDASSGSVDSIGVTKGVDNPSYLTLSKDHTNLYAVNETADSASSAVSAFSFDKENQKLTFLNKRSSRGGAPCYISIDENGKAVFAGNYVGGSVSMFPVRDDGSLAKAKATIQHQGSSINKNRQNSPHVHCTVLSADGKHLLVSDLGTDKVYGYPYDSTAVSLASTPAFSHTTKAGSGPRHITNHPNGKLAYLVSELKATVSAFAYRGDSLNHIQTVSTLAEEYEGPNTAADIHISPDGRFLYASNREDLNDIVIYNIDQQEGTLTHVGRQSTKGVHPRNFVIDPTGNFLLVANRKTDNIVIFKRNKEDGSLTATGQEIKVSQPVCLKLIPVR
ncbi:lactonase family protein [Fodinibius halophilus]|uniref:Lactonase family protein n=1 Tax=Fodinibius halophilus TaxID=1736908 RepID=A0A6M1T1S5_9BACT|nr:lactonase family protein [Fodinibius halophilus]NGP87939.1 lactonase family protein [Fodinibius halophilus]